MHRIMLLIISLVFWSTSIFAASPVEIKDLNKCMADKKLLGQCFHHNVVISQGEINLRKSPPTGIFLRKGELLNETIHRNIIVYVESYVDYDWFFSSTTWIKVKYINVENGRLITGWAATQDKDGRSLWKSPTEERFQKADWKTLSQQLGN